MKITVSGARGVVGSGMDPAVVARLCDSFCTFSDARQCALGTDTRESGHALKEAAAAALLQNGVDVADYGIAPTPVIFRESRVAGTGVVVTASHNPPEWNGLKFVMNGRGVDASLIQRTAPRARARHGCIGSLVRSQSGYVEDAASLVGLVPARVTVALDARGSAALGPARALLEKMGCTVSVIESERGSDPTAGGLDTLSDASRESDMGLAFDPDGDRVVVARHGKILAPDATLAIGTAWSLERGQRSFAISEDTSIAIENMIHRGAGKITRTSVGEVNVVAAIDRHGCDAGGEGSSAGFILPEFNHCRDGILTGAISAAMAASDQLDDALDAMSGYYQVRQKVAAPSDLHAAITERVMDEMGNDFVRMDEMGDLRRFADKTTWVIVRGSNTEDVVRVSVESTSKKKAHDLARRVCEAVGRHGAPLG